VLFEGLAVKISPDGLERPKSFLSLLLAHATSTSYFFFIHFLHLRASRISK
jgi:hypothetical protein